MKFDFWTRGNRKITLTVSLVSSDVVEATSGSSPTPLDTTVTYDPPAARDFITELRERQKTETPEQKVERRERELKKILENEWKRDTAEKFAARDWWPEFHIETGSNGLVFLRYEKEELILDCVENIAVEKPGYNPYRNLYLDRISPAGPGIVIVTMISGRKHFFKTSRWKVDILLKALTEAWRIHTGRSL